MMRSISAGVSGIVFLSLLCADAEVWSQRIVVHSIVVHCIVVSDQVGTYAKIKFETNADGLALRYSFPR